MGKQKRRVFRVKWDKAVAGWSLWEEKSWEGWEPTKKRAVKWGAVAARISQPSTLIVHNKNGRIAFSRSYPPVRDRRTDAG